jgi:4-amino-4-deoxy-L-arabinose transferase-like glycosyltransferase
VTRAEVRFRRRLAFVATAGLAFRALSAWYLDRNTRVGGDAGWYIGTARALANGQGFLDPVHTLFHVRYETAAHPPLFSLFLAPADAIGFSSIFELRLWAAVLGVATIVLVGLTARALVDDRAGLLAAAAAAVSLPLALQDVNLWSEGLFAATIALTMWSAVRFFDRPTVGRAALLAAAVALAALTRAEGALLFGLLCLPLVLRARVPAATRWRITGVMLLTAAVLIAPWAVYNATRFEEPVVLSTGLGGLVSSSNCDTTYRGQLLGGWGFLCGADIGRLARHRDESQMDLVLRTRAWRYARTHADRLPAVVSVRVLRTLGFWRPVAIAEEDLALREGGVGWVAYLAVVQSWLYLGVGVMGAVALARRRRPLLPVLAPIGLVIAISVVGYGTLRFRIALDVVLPVLVGVAAAGWWHARPARSPESAATAA